MSDDWDNFEDNSTPSGVATDGGTTFTAGRGFRAVTGDKSPSWPVRSSNQSAEDDSEWCNVDLQTIQKNIRGGRSGSYRPQYPSGGGWGNPHNESEDEGNDSWGSGGSGGGRGVRGGRGGRGGGRGRGFNHGGSRDKFRSDDDGWSGRNEEGVRWRLRGGALDRGRGGRANSGDNWGSGNAENSWGVCGGDNSWGCGGGQGNENAWEEGGGSGRGRGMGRGMGRGAGRGRGGHNSNENGEEKKREVYVPVEQIEGDDLFTSTISLGVNFMKLTDTEVNVSGENVPEKIESFESSGLRPLLQENVAKSGYKKPTPIQKHAIPIISSGRDLMGCAQTGSGKTAAFLLPIINKMMEESSSPITDGTTAEPNVIIISPTRELAIQIYDQARKFSLNTIVKVELCYGGTSVNHQKNRVTNGCHILVATPGRINDFVSRKHVSFASCKYFVLDEADRMLDMGFLPTVEEMLSHETMTTTGTRQTLMFSATFPEEIQVLAGKFLHNYIFVAVGIVGSASTDVEQFFYQVSKFDKRSKLIDMLKESGGKEKTVVFVETKRNADFLATMLSENDIQTTCMHGSRFQREREQALRDFKEGIRNILVATGVAARGLDIEGVQHVINYDLPKSIDEYVHRIGRTGRVGNRGKATSFYDPDVDSNLAGPLSKILEQGGITVPDFLSGGGYSGGSSDAFGGRDVRGNDYGRNTDSHVPSLDEW